MDSFVQTTALSFPDISPVAFFAGPVQIRWYGLGYVIGIIFAREYGKYLLKTATLWNEVAPIAPQKLNDFLTWAIIGIIIGGRLGEVFFYHPNYYLTNPMQIFALWNGGMSFHGGFLGIICVTILFSLKNRLNSLVLFDVMAAGAPVGLGIVRICNFINSELWGRVTDVPWAILFPNSGTDVFGNLLARHPSQIYESFLEGLVLFIILTMLIFRGKKLRKSGFISGSFILYYGFFRFFVEFFREPDVDYVVGDWLTMGMALSLPMIFFGFYLIKNAASINNKER